MPVCCSRPTGVRIQFDNGRQRVTDGPFIETKELIAGYWLWQVQSKDEAIAWARRIPFGPGAEVEIRQVFEASDFSTELTPELREQEERLRTQMAVKQ